MVETEAVAEREFGSVHILIKPDDIPKLKDIIKTFREQVLALAPNEPVENANVTQVNVQMFKVSI
jgi:response regulator of citrate/malate metabolism